MKYLNTKFHISADNSELMQIAREIVSAIAGECGYESFVDTEDGLDAYVQKEMYSEYLLKESLKELDLENVTISFETTEIEDRNWNETWENEEGFQPIVIDKHLIIYDALHTDASQLENTYAIEIGIKARNAFGTGTHETTRMVISSLLNTNLQDKRLLDCGCGTGILGISAIKCGASAVVAYDIDEWSVENTKYNATLNGVSDKIDVYEGDSKILSHISGLFDVVVANINRNILLDDMESFNDVMNVGGKLIISGFYTEDTPMLVEKAESLKLTLTDKKTDENWQCLTFELN